MGLGFCSDRLGSQLTIFLDDQANFNHSLGAQLAVRPPDCQADFGRIFLVQTKFSYIASEVALLGTSLLDTYTPRLAV